MADGTMFMYTTDIKACIHRTGLCDHLNEDKVTKSEHTALTLSHN